jgi:hypothetical protein
VDFVNKLINKNKISLIARDFSKRHYYISHPSLHLTLTSLDQTTALLQHHVFANNCGKKYTKNRKKKLFVHPKKAMRPRIKANT